MDSLASVINLSSARLLAALKTPGERKGWDLSIIHEAISGGICKVFGACSLRLPKGSPPTPPPSPTVLALWVAGRNYALPSIIPALLPARASQCISRAPFPVQQEERKFHHQVMMRRRRRRTSGGTREDTKKDIPSANRLLIRISRVRTLNCSRQFAK